MLLAKGLALKLPSRPHQLECQAIDSHQGEAHPLQISFSRTMERNEIDKNARGAQWASPAGAPKALKSFSRTIHGETDKLGEGIEVGAPKAVIPSVTTQGQQTGQVSAARSRTHMTGIFYHGTAAVEGRSATHGDAGGLWHRQSEGGTLCSLTFLDRTSSDNRAPGELPFDSFR